MLKEAVLWASDTPGTAGLYLTDGKTLHSAFLKNRSRQHDCAAVREKASPWGKNPFG